MHDEPKQLMRSGRALRVLAGTVAEDKYHPWIAGRATWMEPMSEYANSNSALSIAYNGAMK